MRMSQLFFVLFFIGQSGGLFALSEPSEIKLWPAGEGGDGADKVSLFLHLPEKEDVEEGPARPAIVVCPGGGYGGVVMSYEGNDIARWFADLGFVAFVLKYRVAPHQHPAQMHDVQRAMQFVRASAAQYKIDPERVGVIGFSAGGHLAATAGTKVAAADPDSPLPLARVSSRPDFMVLAYPVISMIDGITHAGSKRNLLGAAPSPELVEAMALEKQVTKETPPTFIFHTDADTVVPAENSLVFYAALRKAGVPAEFHSFRKGPHGVGLGKHPDSKTWPGLLKDWLLSGGFLKPEG
jgi:acetyl esterase/lipase